MTWLFACTMLFTMIWLNINHSPTNWLVMFIVLILLSILTAAATGARIHRTPPALSLRTSRTKVPIGLRRGETERRFGGQASAAAEVRPQVGAVTF